jgi:hypothetical protein
MAFQLPRPPSEFSKKIILVAAEFVSLLMAQWCPAESGQHRGVFEFARKCVQDELGPKQTKKAPKKATFR